MIHEPPIDELAGKIGSKYALCVVVSKRARQIAEQSQTPGAEALSKNKALTIAAQEVYDGNVVLSKD